MGLLDERRNYLADMQAQPTSRNNKLASLLSVGVGDKTDYGQVRHGIKNSLAIFQGLLGNEGGSVMDGTSDLNNKAQLGGIAANALSMVPVKALATLGAPALAILGINKAAQMRGVTTEASALSNALKGQQGAIAWHGSPHKFDKFDMSKIGTGEGAQVYGHGLYFSETPEVAMQYFGKLGFSKNDISKIISENFPNRVVSSEEKSILNNEALYGNNFKNSFKDASDVVKSIKEKVNRYTGDPINAFSDVDNNKMKNVVNAIRNNQTNAIYKVDIPDEAVARFLDWDKPLSQQNKDVLSALGDDLISHVNSYYGNSGKSVYDAVAGNVLNDGGKSLQEWFKSKGIQGIRYLDSGSRGTGKGTSNYVIFNDKIPRILEVNGEATGLQPWKSGEYQLLK